MSKTSRLRGRRMSHNPMAMRRWRPRWIGALLGGLVLPFDPVLGMVLVLVGLARRPAAHKAIR